jgi:hypothetical protein
MPIAQQRGLPGPLHTHRRQSLQDKWIRRGISPIVEIQKLEVCYREIDSRGNQEQRKVNDFVAAHQHPIRSLFSSDFRRKHGSPSDLSQGCPPGPGVRLPSGAL